MVVGGMTVLGTTLVAAVDSSDDNIGGSGGIIVVVMVMVVGTGVGGDEWRQTKHTRLSFSLSQTNTCGDSYVARRSWRGGDEWGENGVMLK